MGRALAAVGIALGTCFAVLAFVVYVTREEDAIAVDQILSERITRAVNDSDLRGESFALDQLTDFAWDRVLIFDARTPRDEVSRELGFRWLGQLEFTAQSTDLFVFIRDGEVVRFGDYRGLGRFAGLPRPFASLTPPDAIFSVRDSVARPVK